MLNGIGENIFNLEFKKEMYETKNGKMIENPKIDTWRTGGKDRVGKAEETKIENGAKLRIIRTFNSLPFKLRSYNGKTVKGFKNKLDKWLGEEVPDQPRLNGMITAAIENTIKCQHEVWKKQTGRI